jgi:hypothetical protein
MNVESSPDEMPEPFLSDRNKNTFRKSFSIMRDTKLCTIDPSQLTLDVISNMINTDETVSDSETLRTVSS